MRRNAMFDLGGIWNCRLENGTVGAMTLPGTLDENRIGHEDVGANQWHPADDLGNATEMDAPGGPITTRLTRNFTYEGEVSICRTVAFKKKPGKRYFVYVERARYLKLFIDEKDAPVFMEGTISTPWIFEVTDLLTGENTFRFVSDNSYKEWPRSDILFSSAATDESQTNWNGILGQFGIIEKDRVFIRSVSVFYKNGKVDVDVKIEGELPEGAEIRLKGDGVIDNAVKEDLSKWDLDEGNLHSLTVKLVDKANKVMDSKDVTYGIRDFCNDGTGHLALNGRRVFLRGETNSAIYPETGYVPMDEEEWSRILSMYRSYGINFVRFHSHCPPEAAFNVADRMGILLQPELSHWNPKDAFSTEKSREYYKKELKQIITCYNNHPSFVMMTLGNELFADEAGHAFMDELMDYARSLDPTRLYANGSNVHYGEAGCDEKSDFYESQSFKDHSLRGTSAGEPSGEHADKKNTKEPLSIRGCINNEYPNGKRNFQDSMKAIRKEYRKPVIGFETGQYEVLPYFEEIDEFKGVTRAYNYQAIKDKAEEKGLLKNWKEYVEATGELSLIGYREEMECAMRTRGLSGTVLLSLQDFSGQGTALVGMMNSHLRPKPFDFAKPERFSAFCKDVLIMAELEKYTYNAGDVISADVVIANYSKEDLGGDFYITLKDAKDNLIYEERIKGIWAIQGDISPAGKTYVPLPYTETNEAYTLGFRFRDYDNEYRVWAYANDGAVCPKDIYETHKLDDKAQEILKNGGKVFYEPRFGKKGRFKNSIKAQFTTDFWSVKTFARQEGGMGLFIDKDHGVFDDFPTEKHTDWQWYPMAMSRAVMIPENIDPIIRELDSYAYMRNMAMLFECDCLGGKLMFSSMELGNKKCYPEVRGLLRGIYKYMSSEDFAPKQVMSVESLKDMTK